MNPRYIGSAVGSPLLTKVAALGDVDAISDDDLSDCRAELVRYFVERGKGEDDAMEATERVLKAMAW